MTAPWPPTTPAEVDAWLATIRPADVRPLSDAQLAEEMRMESRAEALADDRRHGLADWKDAS